MKKIAGKIAMVLIILLLAGSFSGCITAAVYSGGSLDGWGALAFIFTIPLDIITSPIQLIIFAVEMDQSKKLQEKVRESDNIDTFSAKLGFISCAEMISLTEKLNSLPETEKNAFSNKVNSFSQTEISALLEAFNNLSEAEIACSIEALYSMQDETLIAALNSFQYIEFCYSGN